MTQSLLSLFPNSRDLLALSPEELGGILLELVPHVAQRDGKFLIDSVIDPLFPLQGGGYTSGVRRQVILAIAEARSWLESQGLVIYDPEQPAHWLVVTRRGGSLRTRADLEAFRKGRLLPVELLQPALAEKVWAQFLRGDHDVGVFQAFKEVEVAVRKTANIKGAGYPDDLVGVQLMRKAFHHEDGPLRNVSVVSAEREAEAHLFAGAMGHAKNPTSHRDVVLSPQVAARLVVFASHLLGIVEQRGS
jgi:Protein of unknown function (Hypoth_ymh)